MGEEGETQTIENGGFINYCGLPDTYFQNFEHKSVYIKVSRTEVSGLLHSLFRYILLLPRAITQFGTTKADG